MPQPGKFTGLYFSPVFRDIFPRFVKLSSEIRLIKPNFIVEGVQEQNLGTFNSKMGKNW